MCFWGLDLAPRPGTGSGNLLVKATADFKGTIQDSQLKLIFLGLTCCTLNPSYCDDTNGQNKTVKYLPGLVLVSIKYYT